MKNKFFVGSIYRVMDIMNDQITEQDLHKDSRLIIVDDIVFTTEEYLEEVKFTYSIEDIESIEDWAFEDPCEYYFNYVQDEIEYNDFAKRIDVNATYAQTLKNMSNEELRSCNTIETYIKCAKKVILNSMREAVTKLEKEIV